MAARRLATTPTTLPLDALEPAMKPFETGAPGAAPGAGGCGSGRENLSGRRDVIAPWRKWSETRSKPALFSLPLRFAAAAIKQMVAPLIAV